MARGQRAANESTVAESLQKNKTRSLMALILKFDEVFEIGIILHNY